jgi:adenine-specific DNA-methyltransferase
LASLAARPTESRTLGVKVPIRALAALGCGQAGPIGPGAIPKFVGAVGQDDSVLSDLLTLAEQNRVAALSGLDPKTQDSLGQFFTPARAAALIASMPQLPHAGRLRVLDPGAGSGMLTAGLVARVIHERPNLSVHVVAVECDEAVLPQLRDTLDACKAAGSGRVTHELVTDDFITASTGMNADERLTAFDLVIQNPPYAKLAASAPARAAVRTAGVDAPNLYAAFLTLGAAALNPGGQLVAITPRSFCNGPYFGAFRAYLLRQIALDRVHVFESRSTVFADTGVLQENVIFSGTRESVVLSTSNGHEDDAAHRVVKYADVVHPDDLHRFIRIATNDEDTAVAERMLSLPDTLASLGITVSTGRVVDFRSRHCLLTDADPNAAPLVYPGNIRGGQVVWPRQIGKPQWYCALDAKDEKLLVPEGWYCVVKRFSSKEERRRIVAAVWSPEQVPGPVAFENHVNVFHVRGAGLDRDTAFGLSMWLNSSLVDKFFRTFSGHTQVNATDLRTMRFPAAESLRQTGRLAPERLPEQAEIDATVYKVLDVIGVGS